MQTLIALSTNLQQAIRATVDAIAPDAMDICQSNEELIEMVIDANRLATFGNKEADAEIHVLIEQFGYTKVLKKISKDPQFQYI